MKSITRLKTFQKEIQSGLTNSKLGKIKFCNKFNKISLRSVLLNLKQIKNLNKWFHIRDRVLKIIEIKYSTNKTVKKYKY